LKKSDVIIQIIYSSPFPTLRLEFFVVSFIYIKLFYYFLDFLSLKITSNQTTVIRMRYRLIFLWIRVRQQLLRLSKTEKSAKSKIANM